MLGEKDPVRLVDQDPVDEELSPVTDVEGGLGGQTVGCNRKKGTKPDW